MNSLRCLGIQYATDVSRIPSFGHNSSGSSQWKHFPWTQVLFPEIRHVIYQFGRISCIYKLTELLSLICFVILRDARIDLILILNSGGPRISRMGEGRQSSGDNTNILRFRFVLTENCMKLKKVETRGRRVPLGPSL